MIKTAAELLQVASLRTRTVSVRDAEVRIREMSVRARSEFIELASKTGEHAGVWLVRSCVIDDSGNPLFTEEDAKALAEASPEVVEAIASAILEVSGLKKTPEKKA